MNDAPLDALAPERLADLLDVDRPARWSPEDAAAALRHQLAAPLLAELSRVPAMEMTRLEPLAGPRMTFLDLLTASHPAPELLEAVKLWARHERNSLDSPLAGAPATVLYYAAIAAARVRLHRQLTSLPDADLRTGCAWALAQPGAAPLADVFSAALAPLS
jgi:hypothetical protein